MNNKLIHLLERTLNSRSKKLTKQDEEYLLRRFDTTRINAISKATNSGRCKLFKTFISKEYAE